jgi:methylamine--corrinoid protein Co-methyltransferase
MKESDFDMAIARRVPELVKKYGLKYDPKALVPSDDDMAARLYQAGLDLFLEMGAYNVSTQRRILYTKDEVEEAIALAPRDFALGTGKDAVIMRHRGVRAIFPV